MLASNSANETMDFLKSVDVKKYGIAKSLKLLREHSLDDFGKLIWSLPSTDLPHLSSILPSMAPDQVQINWTGSAGAPLLAQSNHFMKWMTARWEKHAGRPFKNVSTLDFGCGWGRLMRMQLYYNDPKYVYGCDAWEGSLKFSRDHNVLGELKKSDIIPETLPFENQMDCIYAYSIFTHTSERATKACLSAIRKTLKPDGLAFITIRPHQFWKYIAARRDVGDVADLEMRHANDEFVHVTTAAAEYGESSFSLEYFRREMPEWEILEDVIFPVDSQQTYLVIRPRS